MAPHVAVRECDGSPFRSAPGVAGSPLAPRKSQRARRRERVIGFASGHRGRSQVRSPSPVGAGLVRRRSCSSSALLRSSPRGQHTAACAMSVCAVARSYGVVVGSAAGPAGRIAIGTIYNKGPLARDERLRERFAWGAECGNEIRRHDCGMIVSGLLRSDSCAVVSPAVRTCTRQTQSQRHWQQGHVSGLSGLFVVSGRRRQTVRTEALAAGRPLKARARAGAKRAGERSADCRSAVEPRNQSANKRASHVPSASRLTRGVHVACGQTTIQL